MGRVCIHLDIEVPDDPAGAVEVLTKVTGELVGKYDLADTNIAMLSHDVVIVDDQGDYDPSDLAFFMLNNRIFSNEAENRIVKIDYDWME